MAVTMKTTSESSLYRLAFVSHLSMLPCQVIADRTKIPVARLHGSEAERLSNLANDLKKVIIGQVHASISGY